MGDILIFLETLIGNVNTMIGINRWLVGIVLMVLLLNGFKNLKAFWIVFGGGSYCDGRWHKKCSHRNVIYLLLPVMIHELGTQIASCIYQD
jgi:hypothetical protein